MGRKLPKGRLTAKGRLVLVRLRASSSYSKIATFYASPSSRQNCSAMPWTGLIEPEPRHGQKHFWKTNIHEKREEICCRSSQAFMPT
jgi:hypothetical protein